MELSSVWSRDLRLFKGRVAKRSVPGTFAFWFVTEQKRKWWTKIWVGDALAAAFPAISGHGIGSG